MAKDISDYARVTTKASTHLFLYETATDGVFGHYLLADLWTLPSGMVVDTDSGVELKLRSGGILGAKVNTAGNFVCENALTVKGVSDLQGRVGVADANGIRTATGLEFFTPGKTLSLNTDGDSNIAGIVLPALAPGGTAVAIKARGFTRFDGGAAGTSVNFTTRIVSPTNVRGTDTFAMAVSNDGEDESATLQTSIDAAVTAFTSAAGRAPQALDSFVLEQTASSSHSYFATVELVYT